MKKPLGVFALVLLVSPFCSASVLGPGKIVYEPFANAVGTNDGTSYTISSNLIGQTNALGLAWAGAGTSNTFQPVISSGNLSVSGLASPIGNEVEYGYASGSTGDTGRLGLGGGVSTGTVYYSLILQVTNLHGLNTLSAGTNGASVAGFNNSTGSGGQPSVIAAQLRMRTNTLGTGGYCFGFSETGANNIWDGTIYNVGDTVFVVASYTFTGTPANDYASLWINPSSATFGANTAPAPLLTQMNGTVGVTGSTIASLLLRQASVAEPDMLADEVRVGLTWADVTPPPAEASSFANLPTGLTITPGTSSVTLSGTVRGTTPATLYPDTGEQVIATINGYSQTNTIDDATGDFSFNFTNNLSTLPASGTPYPITYTYNGNGFLNASTDSSTGLLVTASSGGQSQTITFNSISNQIYGVAPFGVTASASSGLPVMLSVASGPATISSSNVTVTGAGTVAVIATQPGNSQYNSATPVTNSFVVSPLPVVLTGTRAYDGTTLATNAILAISNVVGTDNVTLASGAAALAAANVGLEAITGAGTLTLGGTNASDYALTGVTGTVIISVAMTNGTPLYDPFANATNSGGTSYTIGANLAGQVNSQYLTWYSVGPTGSLELPVIASGNLNVSGLAASSGNSVSYGEGDGDSARLGLGAPVTSGTIYFSMIVQVTSLGSLPTGGAVVAGFNNSTGSQTTPASVIATRLELGLTNSSYSFGVDKSGSGLVWDTGVYNVGDTVFVVGGYTFDSATTNSDFASLWVAPGSSTFGAATPPAPTLTTAAGSDITGGQIESFLLREANLSEPGLTVDEIRIGLTWADVTPPSTITSAPFSITSQYLDSSKTNLIINWTSTPGAIYQVIGASTLGRPISWTNVGSQITAVGTTASATNPVGTSPGFYSVKSP